MKNLIHKLITHKCTLLRLCILLCMIPATTQAQLLGGMIKAKKSVTIINIGIPATITLAQNAYYFVASVYDTDYLPYTVPVVPATTATQAANGVADPTLDVQGTITTTGVTVSIPVTATGSGTLPAYSTTVTIPAAAAQDGISRDLMLSWASQGYTSATTSVTATLKAVGGTLNAKKLDINAGIGNNYLGVLLGQLVYPYNSAGTVTTYSVRDIPGIPDKMFGLADNGGIVRHNFLYFPVTGEDGKVWLGNNLGADYANLNSSSFSPVTQAASYLDYHAYGSLFQWGRNPDGHELVTWSSSTACTMVNGTTTTKNDNPANALFVIDNSAASPYDWRVTSNNNLWTGGASANNPCPNGFRVPTSGDYTNLINLGVVDPSNGMTSALRLFNSTNRSFTNGNLSVYTNFCGGQNGVSVWTSTAPDATTPVNASVFSVSDNMMCVYSGRITSSSRGNGLSVRCISN